MHINARYVVTKKSNDGTFAVGDRIMADEHKKIICFNAGGWIGKADVKEAADGMECKIDEDWLCLQKKKLNSEREWLHFLES